MQEMLGGRNDLGGPQNEAFERWMRGSCLYRCPICGEEFGDSLDFSRHLKRSHDTTLDGMRAGHGGDDRHVVRGSIQLDIENSIELDFSIEFYSTVGHPAKLNRNLNRIFNRVFNIHLN